ncbi:MAG TPA: hypothetical protein DHN29_20160 [Cytophagales bacterium]|jgi:hypothetical protein|nr:hypothetical protein [Cytophagales bacterium]|tara:strand:+ start:70 stop:414 length:345 start_codon:yes stop_codon:yes gene_type:complete
MKVYNDVLLTIKMIDSGIVPYDWSFSASNLRDALETLDPISRRVAQRKFRKLWRKIVSSFKGVPDVYENMKRASGMSLCEMELTSQHRMFRASLVHGQFIKDIQEDAKRITGKN